MDEWQALQKKKEEADRFGATCGFGPETYPRNDIPMKNQIGQACDAKLAEEPISSRLRRTARDQQAETYKLQRVADIMDRHPEFNEFLEVLRSGLV